MRITIIVLLAALSITLLVQRSRQKPPGIVEIPKASSPKRPREISELWDQVLTRKELQSVDSLAEENLALNETTRLLALDLDEKMRSMRCHDLAAIEKSIHVADEIISWEPHNYDAYKSKLAALLVKEGSFQQESDAHEIDELLATMAAFNNVNPKAEIKQAFLLSGANQRLGLYQQELENLALQRFEIEDQLALAPTNDPGRVEQEIFHFSLLLKESEVQEKMDALSKRLETQLLAPEDFLNPDIVEIPFLRLLAKGLFDELALEARGFILDFPSSHIGYFYLVRALEGQGDGPGALDAILNSGLDESAQRELHTKLELHRDENPKDFWKKLCL